MSENVLGVRGLLEALSHPTAEPLWKKHCIKEGEDFTQPSLSPGEAIPEASWMILGTTVPEAYWRSEDIQRTAKMTQASRTVCRRDARVQLHKRSPRGTISQATESRPEIRGVSCSHLDFI